MLLGRAIAPTLLATADAVIERGGGIFLACPGRSRAGQVKHLVKHLRLTTRGRKRTLLRSI